MRSCPNCGRPDDGHDHVGDPCDVCGAQTDGRVEHLPARKRMLVFHLIVPCDVETGNQTQAEADAETAEIMQPLLQRAVARWHGRVSFDSSHEDVRA